MSTLIHYFGFGSNMNHYRLHQRIGDYHNLGVARLHDHRLVFHKCGGDNSGKCTVVTEKGHTVWGIIAGIDSTQKRLLDEFEGVGHGYNAVHLDIEHREQTISALLYQAELTAMDDGLLPFRWYKSYVLTGARQNQLPDSYIQMIEQTPSIEDFDTDRVKSNQKILDGDY